MQGKNRWIVTIPGRQLTARQIAAVTSIIAEQQLNIDGIQRLTGRVPLEASKPAGAKACVGFQCEAIHATSAVCRASSCACRQPKISIYPLQEDTMYRRCRRLVCFDMDSTLIETEVIDELAIRAGVGDKVKAIRERAMRGEIDFDEASANVSRCLKGSTRRDARDCREPAYYRGRRPHDAGVETRRIQDCHTFGRFHLLRQLSQAEVRI